MSFLIFSLLTPIAKMVRINEVPKLLHLEVSTCMPSSLNGWNVRVGWGVSGFLIQDGAIILGVCTNGKLLAAVLPIGDETKMGHNQAHFLICALLWYEKPQPG
ncbi:hypothetical protein [Ketobacter sp.]|uniref:hypothetical protein n=1 Tax=Ketobacter sp. TaxID=2083498 RepID=UPI0025C131EB|nr:hypothetical protein [Ketobacter sp.]